MISEQLTRFTLKGVWPALITPWTTEDRLDTKRLIHQVRAYEFAGVHGLYTGGTTGEFYSHDDNTFREMTAVVCEEARVLGLPVQIGCTALSTRTACQRIRWAIAEGTTAIQIALPFWLELKDEEVVTFFCQIAEAAENVPIILYHTSRAKRKLQPALIGRIASEVPTFIGMKDTGCDIPG